MSPGLRRARRRSACPPKATRYLCGATNDGLSRDGKMLAPEGQAIAWALVPVPVPGFARRTGSSNRDPSLRLTAQEDHEISTLAGLGAQRLIRDDQRRPRRCCLRQASECVLRNDNPVERGFRVARLLRGGLTFSTFARPRIRLLAMRTPAVQ